MGVFETPPLLLVGGGKMGGALLAGWMDRGLSADRVRVIEPNADLATRITESHGVAVHAALSDLPDTFKPGLIMLAVKPQMMDQVLPAYVPFAGQSLFLSIAAGKPIGFFIDRLGQGTAVVRTMPNTPAAVGRGITALCANERVDAAGCALCTQLLSAVGETVWIDDESLMDAVTAVSGSGPAYVFLLAEAMAEAGVKAGLPPRTAAQLARATVSGAGELLRRSEEDAAQLRINVTSPGGTTAAALDVLMAEKGMTDLMTKAVAAAERRGRELAD
ncbi:pyrroline-5-carboxylate reductase [Magnetospira sp. QH-2]|uniref:pyrroline-5-carboxylate reductase n=1 Tax=Magnetospira sp. (strain QH-2) TaxID=1288970 RepID=UPI0003E813DC|nr:pyrroline-5-carboxylate reductase [Magnetospira sp. QH-2]CCQ72284.1 Pyrroline-5-carboxylate reductase [Magnetospira sp. QH-2]